MRTNLGGSNNEPHTMSLAFLAGLFAFITTILWLVIGWRAMKAHEALSESMRFLRSDVSKIADHLAEKNGKPGSLPKIRD